MKIALCFVLLNTVFADVSFGSSYLKNNRLCKQWNCINNILGLPDTLPPKDQLVSTLKSILPDGSWQDAVEKVVTSCYDDRSRKYTNTCPGQSLLHCVYDNLIQNCPENSLRKNDACAPLSSLAGLKYMFSQSRYENLEKNLPVERRPVWFLKNYFSSKCCNLPEFFNSTAMAQCGFSTAVHYYTHEPNSHGARPFNSQHPPISSKSEDGGNKLHIVDINLYNMPETPVLNNKEDLHVVELTQDSDVDPLDCCDVSDLIQPSWRSDCDFHLSWNGQHRLQIENTTDMVTPAPTTSTSTTAATLDLKIVPVSCESETCIFRKLNVIGDDNTIDLKEFERLLDNLTSEHPEWTQAKARVVRYCFNKHLMGYDDKCQINKLLSCTFDVLTENCPHATPNDNCKHGIRDAYGPTCQISIHKFRPKNRRRFCPVPNLVSHDVLSRCNVSSIKSTDYVHVPPPNKPKRSSWWTSRNICKELTTSTKCLLDRMGVMSKYGFMDYFKMKDAMRRFTEKPQWHALADVYISTFSGMPLYKDHCSSSKKFLNVLDSMVSTCPISSRKNTSQCNKLFNDMATTPTSQPAPQQNNPKLPHIVNYFSHILRPHPRHSTPRVSRVTPTPKTNKHGTNLNSIDINQSEVKTMNIKSQVMSSSKRPLILLPVYLRTNGVGKGSVTVRKYRDPALRMSPIQLNGLTGSYSPVDDIQLRK